MCIVRNGETERSIQKNERHRERLNYRYRKTREIGDIELQHYYAIFTATTGQSEVSKYKENERERTRGGGFNVGYFVDGFRSD